jgi:hypothetical protein
VLHYDFKQADWTICGFCLVNWATSSAWEVGELIFVYVHLHVSKYFPPERVLILLLLHDAAHVRVGHFALGGGLENYVAAVELVDARVGVNTFGRLPFLVLRENQHVVGDWVEKIGELLLLLLVHFYLDEEVGLGFEGQAETALLDTDYRREYEEVRCYILLVIIGGFVRKQVGYCKQEQYAYCQVLEVAYTHECNRHEVGDKPKEYLLLSHFGVDRFHDQPLVYQKHHADGKD